MATNDDQEKKALASSDGTARALQLIIFLFAEMAGAVNHLYPNVYRQNEAQNYSGLHGGLVDRLRTIAKHEGVQSGGYSSNSTAGHPFPHDLFPLPTHLHERLENGC
eukprot:IDg14268t1